MSFKTFEPDQSGGRVFVWYGRPGTGKTSMIESLINSGRKVAVIDIDRGLEDSLADAKGSPNLKVARCSSWDEYRTALMEAYKLGPEWIVIQDTFTRAMTEFARTHRKKGGTIELKDHMAIGYKGEDIVLLAQQKKLAGYTTVLICHEQFTQFEDQRANYTPKMPGKYAYGAMPDKVDGMFRFIVESGATGMEWKVMIKASDVADTKDRLPRSVRDSVPDIVSHEEFVELFNKYLAPEGR